MYNRSLINKSPKKTVSKIIIDITFANVSSTKPICLLQNVNKNRDTRIDGLFSKQRSREITGWINDYNIFSVRGGWNFWSISISSVIEAEKNRRHYADDVFKCNFLNENGWTSIRISLKFVHKGTINNIPALVQIMAWRQTGYKPLSEQMMTQFNAAYMHHSASMS